MVFRDLFEKERKKERLNSQTTVEEILVAFYCLLKS